MLGRTESFSTMASSFDLQTLHTRNTQQFVESSSEDDRPSKRKRTVLSEEQKNQNHVNSEKKRRERIREQFDNLANIIPGMEGQGRAESKILAEAVKYGYQLVEKRKELIAKAKALGIALDAKFEDPRFLGPRLNNDAPEAEPDSSREGDEENSGIQGDYKEQDDDQQEG